MAEFVIYEGHFFDRWVAAELVGETPAFWIVQRPNQDSTRKIKKTSNHIIRFSTWEAADKAAQRVTAKLLGAKKHYDQRKAEILKEARNG